MPATRKFHSIAALCGDGLRPELQALFERLAIDPCSELFVREDGMVQSGPDPVSAAAPCSQLFFVAPGAQQESPALATVGSGLRLKVGQIGAGSIDPPSGRHPCNQPDRQE
jgi:hypothetical protein